MPRVTLPKKEMFLISTWCQKLSVPYNPWKNGWLQDVVALKIIAL